MNCYIKVENGQAVGHPALEENLLDVYGQIPEGWEPLTLVDPRTLPYHPLKEYWNATYQLVNGSWTQVWEHEYYSPEILAMHQQQALDRHLEKEPADNFTTWVYDSDKDAYVAPIERPDDGKNYRWHGPSHSFKEAPPKPTDDKKYSFNFYTWVWEEIV